MTSQKDACIETQAEDAPCVSALASIRSPVRTRSNALCSDGDPSVKPQRRQSMRLRSGSLSKRTDSKGIDSKVIDSKGIDSKGTDTIDTTIVVKQQVKSRRSLPSRTATGRVGPRRSMPNRFKPNSSKPNQGEGPANPDITASSPNVKSPEKANDSIYKIKTPLSPILVKACKTAAIKVGVSSIKQETNEELSSSDSKSTLKISEIKSVAKTQIVSHTPCEPVNTIATPSKEINDMLSTPIKQNSNLVTQSTFNSCSTPSPKGSKMNPVVIIDKPAALVQCTLQVGTTWICSPSKVTQTPEPSPLKLSQTPSKLNSVSQKPKSTPAKRRTPRKSTKSGKIEHPETPLKTEEPLANLSQSSPSRLKTSRGRRKTCNSNDESPAKLSQSSSQARSPARATSRGRRMTSKDSPSMQRFTQGK